jgi:hypothetical protein
MLLLAAVTAACAAGGVDNQPTPQPVTTPVNPTPGVDITKLRLRVPGDQVVVRARGRPFIRAEEYNAWLGTYPLNITEADQLGAQKQALDQMVTFRLLLERATAAGYDSKAANADAASIVLRYLGDQVRNMVGVSDADALRYYEEHRDQLGGLDVPEIAPEVRMAALKGSVRGAQLAAQLEDQKKEAEVTILLPPSGSPERTRDEKSL